LDFRGAPPTAELTTTWRDLTWPGSPVTSPSGELTLAGTADAYRFDAAGTVVVTGRNASFTAAGTGAELELAFERAVLTTDAGRGTLQATGSMSLETRETRLALTAADFDPAWIDARWPGRLRGTATLRAALGPIATAELAEFALNGELRGYPVTIGGGATFTAPRTVRLAALRLDSKDNRAVLTGTLDDANVDVTVDAALTSLDLLVPGAAGAVNAAGTVRGTWREPRVRGRIAARDVSVASIVVAQLDADGEAGLAPTAPAAFTIEASGLSRGPVAVERVRAALTGTTGAHTATITATAADWDA